MKKILVAEDEQAIREFVVINLRRAGYDTYEAETGDKALEIYERENGDIDVAVLDIMMPGNNDGSLQRTAPPQQLHRNYYADSQNPRDGQGQRLDDGCRRLCDQALQPFGIGGKSGCGVSPSCHDGIQGGQRIQGGDSLR